MVRCCAQVGGDLEETGVGVLGAAEAGETVEYVWDYLSSLERKMRLFDLLALLMEKLVFDNRRVLHGRSAFSGRREMCGGYSQSFSRYLRSNKR